MTKRVGDTVILDAIVGWAGHVTAAAASIRMPRGHYYSRLKQAGVGKEQLKALRKTGQLVLASGKPYVLSKGSVRYVQPEKNVRSVQLKNIVPMKSAEAAPTLEPVSAAATSSLTPIAVPLKVWRPRPERDVQLMFEEAVIELAKAGWDTDKDGLLDVFVRERFPAYRDELLRLITLRNQQAAEEGDER